MRTKYVFVAWDSDLMWLKYFVAGLDLNLMEAKLFDFEGWMGFLCLCLIYGSEILFADY